MNLTTRLAKLEKHQPQIDQEQRQKMIASIEQWLVELEVKAQTDPDTRLYLEAIRGMLAEKRSAPRGQFTGAKSGSSQGCSLQAAKVDVAAVAAPIVLQGLHDLIVPMPRATLTKRASQIEKRGRPQQTTPPKGSALEKPALRIMRNLYEATGGQPQRWESLDNLGAVKADAPGIAYAIERNWLVVSGGLHSASLTEDGRRRVK